MKQMISILFWFMILSSGGVLCAAVWKKRYEEILCITCSVIVLILFLCGVLKAMILGGILVCVMGGAASVFAVIWIVRKKSIKEFVKNFFTPAFVAFLIVFVFSCYANYGRLATKTDEFSHWADIVKAMTVLDDFGTNPESNSGFQSYPPGMSLFQYFLQKLYTWSGSGKFSEWQLYLAYQVFAFAFILPFLRNLRWKKPIVLPITLAIIFLCPLLFYQEIYTTMYIDPVLGLLSGTGLTAIFLCKERDKFHSLRVLLTCAMLVLAKDAGLFFAAFLALAYVLDYAFICKGKTESRKIEKVLYIIGAICAVGIPKWLWNLHLKLTGAKISFENAFSFSGLIDVLLNRDDSYRRFIWSGYYPRLITEKIFIGIGNAGISLNYLIMLFGIMGLFFVLCRICQNRDGIYKKKCVLMGWVLAIQFTAYIIGLCVTYMFNFGEYEGTRYASYDRYIGIVFLSAWVVCILLFLGIVQAAKRYQYIAGLVAIGVMTLASPITVVRDYVTRASVNRSIQRRSAYQPLVQEIEEFAEEGSSIYIISQESNGYDHLVIKFAARSYKYQPRGSSIGEKFYEGDVWTRVITAEEWKGELLQYYDYVAVFRINEYFAENFAILFESKEDIGDDTLYKVNKELGMLEKCK